MKHAKNSISSAGELLLYGEIGSWWDDLDALGVVRQLEALNKDQIVVRIHSGGGLILEGLAIYNRLKESAAKVTVHIDGLAASMASVVAMAGDKVIMPENAWMMVHKPWVYTDGNADQLRKTADTLDGFEGSLIGIYAAKSGRSEEEIATLLADETWINAAQALELGFIDEISSPVKAAASIDLSTFNKVPADLLQSMSAQPKAAQSVNSTEENLMSVKDKQGTADPKAANENTVPAANAVDATKAANEAVVNERLRVSEITKVVAMAKMPQETAFTLIESGATVQDAKDKALEFLASREPRVSSFVTVHSNMESAREAITNAFLNRVDPSGTKLNEGGREFRSLTTIEVCRNMLEAGGISTRFMSANDIAAKALSTSDFPLILGDVVNRRLRAGYESAPRTFQTFCRRSDVADYRAVSRPILGEAPSLEQVNESGEYKYGKLGEESQSYRLKKYGKIIPITREMIINDDLSAFTRIAEAFGSSAAETESEVVYGLITGNVKLADNVALFHANHNNLGTTGALSETTLSEARKKLRRQTGVSTTRPLNLMAEYLIVPAALETSAEKILTAVLAEATANVNVFANKLKLIVEPRLDDSSATAWYLAASPMRIDTIEYGYLNGTDGVYTETRQGFEIDGLEVKARLEFAAGVIDHRGLFKNAGA